ncbi:hypothetical protein [Streptomyces mesophilus]|uniref:hypothetical protein n=1 Tax=Streptomyces mesophilus TaxID=1775132 RepID=UPI00331E0089
MGTSVLSLRIDGELLDRLRHHAGIRGMNVQDYVIRALVRNDFDERFKAAVEETQRFYEDSETTGPGLPTGSPGHVRGAANRGSGGSYSSPPATQVSPSAGIR